MSERWVEVPDAEALVDGEFRSMPVEGLDGAAILVARCEGELRAVEDRCSHDDGPLGDGAVEGCGIICPRHGARFDLRDGCVTRMPAIAPIRSLPLRIEDGRVTVNVEEL